MAHLARVRSSTAIAALLAAALPGQSNPLGPRSFFPPDYQGEAYIDLAALRGSDVWDVVERSLWLRQVVSQLERAAHIDLDDVDRVRLGARWRPADAGAPGSAPALTVLALEGRPALRLPAVEADQFEERRIGDHRVLRRPHVFESYELWVSPRPGVLVVGDEAHIAAILAGEKAGGVPHPELLALVAQPKALAYVAAGRLGQDWEIWRRGLPLPQAWLSEDDRIELFGAALRTGPGGEIIASLTARFAAETDGPKRLEAAVREALARAASEARLREVHPLLARIALRNTGPDLIAELNLGQPRAAAKEIAVLVTLFAGGLWAGLAEPTPVAEPAVPPPQPERKGGDPAPRRGF